ncbi:tetratricopeptide repeat protein [Sorangium sp. So ce385]|uniref:tetratricopeptide repeat protein n=1 Tax=Sorangium sp. So ce385 TaxID=3133308 RepID=UPI003F5C51DD
MTGTQKPEIDLDRLPAIFAAEARGEPIRPEDAALLRRAEQEDPELRGEARLWAAIGRLGDERGAGLELSDAALLGRVLARAHVEPAPRSAARPRAAPRPALRRGVAWTLAGVAAAATLLGALAAELIDGPAQAPPPAPGTSEALAPSGAPPAPATAAPGAPSPGPGAPSPGAGAPSPSAGAPSPGAGAPSPGAGAAPNEPPGAPSPGPGEAAPPSEPSPRAGSAASEPAATGAGGARDRAPQPPRPRAEELPIGPEALLLRAQARLGEGKTAEASAAYRALLAQHPSSPEARAALVSLGQIALRQGKPAEALGHFERYLAGPGGPLAAEARVGRVQCLRRLGRAADERAAIADFLSRHGQSVHAPRLRARLSELGGT